MRLTQAVADQGSGSARGAVALRELVLLAGSVGASDLITATGRAPFDLPVTPDRTVLGMWQAEAEALALAWDLPKLVLRLMLDHRTPMPSPPPSTGRVKVVIERDPQEYRGSGGVLSDLARRLAPTDTLLVANAAQVLLEPLTELAQVLASTSQDVAILGQGGDTPSGLMMLRAQALMSIKPIGYVDLKEQALPSIAERFDVRVAQRDRPATLPTRTLVDYIESLRLYHRLRRGDGDTVTELAELDPFAEDWQSTFAILEPGVRVKSGARLHDSVALRGAVIERDAVLVRSIVGPGGVVRAGDMVVGQIVSGERDTVAAGLAAGRQTRPGDQRGEGE